MLNASLNKTFPSFLPHFVKVFTKYVNDAQVYFVKDNVTFMSYCLNKAIPQYASYIISAFPSRRVLEGRKEGNVLFNDALNTFYLWLYGVRHMVKDHSVSGKENPLPPHRLLFPINSKGSFIRPIAP